MPYRPQYSYPRATSQFEDVDFVHYFDLVNNSAPLPSLQPGVFVEKIALPLQRDAPFIWRGIKVGLQPNNPAGLIFYDPWEKPLSDDFQSVAAYSPLNSLGIGAPPMIMEPEIECPAGANVYVAIKNLQPLGWQQFAVLSGGQFGVNPGSFNTFGNTQGQPGDVGVDSAVSIWATSTATLGGNLRFKGPVNVTIQPGGTLIDLSQIANDALTAFALGQIIPLAQNYLSMAPLANQILPNVINAPTVVSLAPGVTYCPVSLTVNNAVFDPPVMTWEFTGSINDTYILLVNGDITIGSVTFAQFPPNFIVVADHIYIASLQTGAFPTTAASGTWIAAGLIAPPANFVIQANNFTLTPGRILVAPNANGSASLGFTSEGDATAPSSVTLPSTGLSPTELPIALYGVKRRLRGPSSMRCR